MADQDYDIRKIEEEARKSVKELREFYVHAGTFVVVNAFLVVLNLMTSPGSFWAIWPLLGWGIGLASHAFSVFGLFGIGSQSWEERKVREFMLSRQQNLTTSEVRHLLHEELDDVTALRTGEWERMVRRLENLETIVTSREWDLLESTDSTSADNVEPEETEAEDRAARLARRVR